MDHRRNKHGRYNMCCHLKAKPNKISKTKHDVPKL